MTTSTKYDAASEIERSELKLAQICYTVGLNGSSLSALSIDEIIAAIRTHYRYTSPLASSTEPAAVDWNRQANFHLIIQARKYWWTLQLAKGAQARG